jgi:hypothetical protein
LLTRRISASRAAASRVFRPIHITIANPHTQKIVPHASSNTIAVIMR